MVTNRAAGHVGAGDSAGASGRKDPPLARLRDVVRGECDFHIVRGRGGKYRIGVGRAADAVAHFRHPPDQMEDVGLSRAWQALHDALASAGGPARRFELTQPEWAEWAMNLAALVGGSVNTWRLATGRADFPPADLVARAVGLPEPLVRVALEEYRDATR